MMGIEGRNIFGRLLKSLLFLFFTMTALLISGCFEDESSDKFITSKFANAYGAEDSWLVYWYVCGTDLETGLGAATMDMEELFEVGLPSNVKVLIQTGGAQEWQNDTMEAHAIGRYLYDADGLHELAQVEDADMGSPETLADFLQYGKDNFTADHRAFVFWDHGGGSAAGVCLDERTGNSLKLNDIRQAFTAVHPAAPENPPFELIGFDACLMATYDVANTLHGLGRYMVASEEIEPGNGWEYTGWVRTLGKNPAMGGAALGQVICDSYMEGCVEYGTEDAVTLSVIDLAQIPALRSAYENFGVEALRQAGKNPRSFFSSFGREAKQAENYGGNTRDQGFANMVDLGDLAKETANLLPDTSRSLIGSIEHAVIYKVHGDYREKSSGISGFYSYNGDAENFAIYAAQDAAPLSIKCLYHYLIYGEMPPEAGTLLSGGSPGSPALSLPSSGHPSQSIFSVASLEDLVVDVDGDGNSFVRLSEEQMELLASIHCQLIYIDDEDDVILYLGSDADIDADWERGIFKDNFRGVWPMLDGHPVYIEITAEGDDYNIYSVPIKLNGMECNLQVAYTYGDGKYHILGARKGIGDSGMGDRNLIKLKRGDTITTIHYGMTISGDDEDFTAVDVDTFTVGDAPVFQEEELGNGVYGYCFEFVTPIDDSAMSRMVQFTLENGEITTTIEEI